MWWFYTVILGTSFAQVLGEIAIAVREWSQDRERRPFAAALLWQVFLLALIVEVWLAVTYYRDTVTQISILELLGFLAVPAGILIMSFLLPAAKRETGDAALSPSASFDRVRRVFFGVLIGVVAVNLLHGLAIGQQGWDLDLLFQCLIIAGGVVGLFLRRPRADTALAAVMIAVITAYIGFGYSTVIIDSTG